MKWCAPVVDCGTVHCGPSLEQQANELGVLSLDGHVQTAQAVLIGPVNAASLLDEHLGDLVEALVDRQHDGGNLVHRHSKVDVWIDFVD